MKVLVFTNIYPNSSHPYFGVFVKTQVESLEEYSASDCFEILAVKTKKAGGNHYNYLLSFFKLFYHRIFSNFDVIHCHHAFCVFMAKCLFFNKIVYTNHEGEYFKGGFLEGIKRRAISLSDKVIFVNSDMLIQNTKLCKNEPFLIPCAVDQRYFINNKSKADCREVLGLNLSDRIIFFPANPDRDEKNYKLLIDALEIWDESKSGKKPAVVCGGSIEYKNIWVWYKACDVVISCSKYESDGMIYKESIICNRFFISPDVGNAKLYSNDGETGYIFNNYEPLTLNKAIVDFFHSSNYDFDKDKKYELETIDDQASRLLSIYNELKG
ncbi:TPA: glycosyltransferase [Vibrio vulnificus]|nr:glycosyltransferase [Vibrio vulnificus]HAS6413516.1 glycosyltransferase [Vibrio vulnificus]